MVLWLPQPQFGQLDAGLLQHADRAAGTRLHDAAQQRDEAELPAQQRTTASLLRAIQQQVAAELRRIGVRRIRPRPRSPTSRIGFRARRSPPCSRTARRSTSNGASSAGSWWTRPGANEISREDLDTQQIRGEPQRAVHRPEPPHEHFRRVVVAPSTGTRTGRPQRRSRATGICSRGRPTTFLRRRTTSRPSGAAASRRRPRSRPTTRPFDFENDVIAPVGVRQRHLERQTLLRSTAGSGSTRSSRTTTSRARSGDGPFQQAVTYPAFEFHRLNGFVPRISGRLRRVRHRTHRDQGWRTAATRTTPAR